MTSRRIARSAAGLRQPVRLAPCLTTLALALAGCTSQAWYESARQSAALECQKQPAGAYEECMSRVNQKSYEDYRREREAVKQTP